jgi:hypothetical protein
MDGKQASRNECETLLQHDVAEQKHAVEIFKCREKKRFERRSLHREISNKYLSLAHPFRLVALKLDAHHGSAFS